MYSYSENYVFWTTNKSEIGVHILHDIYYGTVYILQNRQLLNWIFILFLLANRFYQYVDQ